MPPTISTVDVMNGKRYLDMPLTRSRSCSWRAGGRAGTIALSATAGPRPGVRVAAAPLGCTAPAVELSGELLLEWGGALRWLRAGSSASTAEAVRSAASRAGGHATLFRAADKSPGAFAPLPPVLARLHRGLKQVFDPAGILNPGRLYAEF